MATTKGNTAAKPMAKKAMKKTKGGATFWKLEVRPPDGVVSVKVGDLSPKP